MAALAMLAFQAQCLGGVTIDGTLSPAATLSGPNYQINAAHGAQVGNNLFHSLGQFSLVGGESAVFNGPAGLSNIIGRVTGGAVSSVNGTIQSTVSGANLFLVNPAGWIFGPSAALSVSGSFYASSAHYLKFADGARFDAVNPAASTLTAAAPSAFGFMGPSGAIALNGGRLIVPTGKSLGLVGGDITVQDGTFAQTMRARGGRIDLVSAASAGEVAFVSNGLQPAGMAALGNITLSGNAASPATVTVEVGELGGTTSGGGSVAIRGGRIVLDGTKVRASTAVGNSGRIDIAGSGDVSIDGGDVLAVTTGAGKAGAIAISGNNVTISGGALVDGSCDPGCTTGAGGAVSVSAGNVLRITGNAGAGEITGVVSNTLGGGPSGLVRLSAPQIEISGSALVQSSTEPAAGQPMNTGNATGIAITGGGLAINGGAQVISQTRSLGSAGRVDVALTGGLSIDGTGPDLQTGNTVPSGIFANTLTSANAGTISISAGSLSITGGGEISSSTLAAGSAGAVSIDTAGAISVSGYGFATPTGGGAAARKSSAILSNSFGAGNAGSIALSAGSVSLAGSGQVSSRTTSTGNAGTITIATVGPLSIAGGGKIISTTTAGGNAGTINIASGGAVSVSGYDASIPVAGYPGDRSAILLNTLGGGNAGSLALNAPSLELANHGVIQSSTIGAGRGGDVLLQLGSLSLSSGGQIASEAGASGAAGSIRVAASGDIGMTGAAGTTTGLLANTLSSGNGGSIDLQARALSLSAGAGISASTQVLGGNGGTISIRTSSSTTLESGSSIESIAFFRGGPVAVGGNAGNIDIDAGNRLTLNDSRIRTEAFVTDGGNVNIRATELVYLYDSAITTAVGFGFGSGGNITIAAPRFLVLNGSGSDIIANAFGGNGGNITIIADNFLRSPDSVVSASSRLGVSGTIVISSPVVDVSGTLAALPVNYLDNSGLLASQCAARLAGRASSLVLAGRGSVPFTGDGYLPVLAAAPERVAADVSPVMARRAAPYPLLGTVTGCRAG